VKNLPGLNKGLQDFKKLDMGLGLYSPHFLSLEGRGRRRVKHPLGLIKGHKDFKKLDMGLSL
jgi:hypothetical protein